LTCKNAKRDAGNVIIIGPAQTLSIPLALELSREFLKLCDDPVT
jgi:hypothetical protein